MSLITWIILFCLMGGLLSVLAAALFLVLSEPLRNNLLPHLVSFATGALLGAAFLGLLPHAMAAVSSQDTHVIPMAVLLGLLGFFLLEKLVLWRHCHEDHCEVHAPDSMARKSSAGTLILIGDGLHNFLDGILIAGAFLTDIHLGVVTSLAVAAHEIPQEVGDFAVLLHSGFSRGRAFFYNVLSSLTTVIGGILAYVALQDLEQILPYVLAVAASSFIYIAVADLIPTLHQRVAGKEAFQQILLIGTGILLIYAAHSTLH
jgi:zinc and cadmium transporter